MNIDKTLLERGSLSFDDALNNKMNWCDIIRFWDPNATDVECVNIYDSMKKLAYEDAVIGRRTVVNEGMIFDRIKYTQFSKLNCH